MTLLKALIYKPTGFTREEFGALFKETDIVVECADLLL